MNKILFYPSDYAPRNYNAARDGNGYRRPNIPDRYLLH